MQSVKPNNRNEQIQNTLRRALAPRCDPATYACVCGCLPEILDLLKRLEDQPVEVRASAVRSLIVGRCETPNGTCKTNPWKLQSIVGTILSVFGLLSKTALVR